MKTALINVKTDSGLKNRARAVAQRLGLPLGTIINNYLRCLVEEKRVVFSVPLVPNKQTGALLKKASQDYHARRNLVGPFRDAAEMDTYLDA